MDQVERAQAQVDAEAGAGSLFIRDRDGNESPLLHLVNAREGRCRFEVTGPALEPSCIAADLPSAFPGGGARREAVDPGPRG